LEEVGEGMVETGEEMVEVEEDMEVVEAHEVERVIWVV
jgi:hypothetical protein